MVVISANPTQSKHTTNTSILMYSAPTFVQRTTSIKESKVKFLEKKSFLTLNEENMPVVTYFILQYCNGSLHS